jgi:Hint module
MLLDPEPYPGIDVGEVIGISCFSEVSTVLVQGKGPLAMKDLRVGDKILTANNEYLPVYAFGHYLPSKEAEFLQVSTGHGMVLEMTGDHLVFLADEMGSAVRADSLQVGDVLRGHTDIIMHTITKIGTVQRTGLYAPLTESGTLVVDRIVVSNYVSLQTSQDTVQLQNGWNTGIPQHDYVHMGLAPLRLLCLGVSGRFCATDSYIEGMPWYVAFSVSVNLWVNQQTTMVQLLSFSIIGILTGICFATEAIVGAAHAPLAMLLTLAMLTWTVVHRRRPQKAVV